MNLTDVTQIAAARTGIERETIRDALRACLDVIREYSMRERITLLNFGRFEPRPLRGYAFTSALSGRNVRIPDRVKPSFRPADSWPAEET